MQNKITKYDAIVVGGSCAGAAAAFTLANAGKNCLIIDKERFPRKKLCGGMITEKTVFLLRDLYGNIVLEDFVDSSYKTFGIYHAKLGKISKCSDPTDKLYFVDRTVFDQYFLNEAIRNGCTLLSEHKVVLAKDGSVVLDSGEELFGDIIIGADGSNSVVRKYVDNSARKHQHAVGLEIDAKYEELKCFDDGIYPKIYFGYMNCGYAWVFPKKNLVTIGLGGVIGQNEKNMRELFIRFLQDVAKSNESLTKRIGGLPVPLHNFTRRPGRKRVLLVGDAAGFVEPITGEGIYFAILSGMLAARAVLSASNHVKKYTALLEEDVYPLMRQAYFVKRFYFNPRILLYAMNKMKNNAKYCKYYFGLLSGKLNYIQYFKAVLKDRKKYSSE